MILLKGIVNRVLKQSAFRECESLKTYIFKKGGEIMQLNSKLDGRTGDNMIEPTCICGNNCTIGCSHSCLGPCENHCGLCGGCGSACHNGNICNNLSG
jgi:hypothetical protein